MAEALKQFQLPPERMFPVVVGSWWEQVFLFLKRNSDELGWEKGIELFKQHWSDRAPVYAERTLQAFKVEERDARAWGKYITFIVTTFCGPGAEAEVLEYEPTRWDVKFTFPEGKCAPIRAVESLGIQDEINTGTVHCRPWNEKSVKAVNPKLELVDFKCIALGDDYCGGKCVLKE